MSLVVCEQARGCWDCPERARLEGLVAAAAEALRAEAKSLAASWVEIDRLLAMLDQARREAADLRHRIEWDDLED